MLMRRHILRLAVALSAIGISTSWVVPQAEASITITLSNGTGSTSATNPADPTTGGTSASIASGAYFGGAQGPSVQVNILGATQSLNDNSSSQTDSTSIRLSNTSAVAETLTLTVLADRFFVPPAGHATATDSFGTSNITSGSSADFVATVQGNPQLTNLHMTGAGQNTVSPPPVE